MQVDLKPPGVALDLGHDHFRASEGPSRPHGGRRDVHVRHILHEPIVKLFFDVAPFFPRPDLLALHHLDVV